MSLTHQTLKYAVPSSDVFFSGILRYSRVCSYHPYQFITSTWPSGLPLFPRQVRPQVSQTAASFHRASSMLTLNITGPRPRSAQFPHVSPTTGPFILLNTRPGGHKPPAHATAAAQLSRSRPSPPGAARCGPITTVTYRQGSRPTTGGGGRPVDAAY